MPGARKIRLASFGPNAIGPDFYDTPAYDIEIVGREYISPNPFSAGQQDQVTTGAYHPSGRNARAGETIPGEIKSNGTILRFDPDGENLEVFSWGLRNPYGVLWGDDGRLYVSENGFDVRGSRPIANDKEDLYVIEQGDWCGWPDFASGVLVTHERFNPKDKPGPKLLMKEHPKVKEPLMTFPPHSAIAKMDFCTSKQFGHEGELFIAFFGHMAPMTGTVEKHGGHRVVRVNPATQAVETFFGK